MNIPTKQKEAHQLREQTYGCRGGGIVKGVWDGHVHTVILKMDDQQGLIVEHRELCSMLCGSLDGRRVWGRMDPCICVSEFLCCLRETITALLIGYTPI